MNSLPVKFVNPLRMAVRYSSSYEAFKQVLDKARDIVVLTGAGVSAESGIPTFRGSTSSLWRTHSPQDLATPIAFRRNPALVWEFYHYRREVAFNSQPNNAHKALAQYEKICKEQGRHFTVVTQNVDGLHQRAGSENVIELHGALREVICTKCGKIETNTDRPICEALRGRENSGEQRPTIPLCDLPKCKHCNSLLRPHIVWFGEQLDVNVLSKTRELLEKCDLCLVVGTSSVVYPAAMFAPLAVERGVPVAEFNITGGPAEDNFAYHFCGKCGETLPKAFCISVE